MSDTSNPDLSHHETESVKALTAFHREHYRTASALQNVIDRTTDRLGRPKVVVSLIVLIAVWTAVTAVTANGRVDQPGFAWLELSATLAALLISILILVTQRREDQLADRREQLTLELALIADRKTAKLIALIEELRRDQPGVVDRTDPESEEMAKPADTGSVLAAMDRQSGRKPSSTP